MDEHCNRSCVRSLSIFCLFHKAILADTGRKKERKSSVTLSIVSLIVCLLLGVVKFGYCCNNNFYFVGHC